MCRCKETPTDDFDPYNYCNCKIDKCDCNLPHCVLGSTSIKCNGRGSCECSDDHDPIMES